MNQQQIDNLDRLATKLESLPEDYEQFDMSVYYGTLWNSMKEDAFRYARHNGGISCGSVSCAVGHGPSAGILVPEHLISNVYGIEWDRYAYFAFGARPGSSGGIFYWLFSSDWNQFDNTPWGAAARIRYLLDKKSPPANLKYTRLDDIMSLYEPYLIKEQRPLPDDFYTSLPEETQRLIREGETVDSDG